MKDYHRLLKRQWRKSGLDDVNLESMEVFLDNINATYKNFDKDVNHLEHILEISSQELFKANQSLKADVAVKDILVKNALDHLDNVVNSVNGIIFQTDKEGIYTYLNHAWEKVTGLKREESIGQHFSGFFKFITSDTKEIYQKLADKKNKIRVAFSTKFVNGRERWIELSMNRIFDNEGDFNGVIGTFTDITNQKIIEQDLRIAREHAEKASQAKDEFLSTMSHEIRTPLNAVIGLSNILLMNDPLPSQLENLEALKYSSEHLLGLINDILDFSKIESGKLEFENEDFNLNQLLVRIKKTYEYNAKLKGLKFQMILDSDLPEVVKGDSVRLAQIISNFVTNALKFTKKGRVAISATVQDEQAECYRIGFEIKDTGIGIPLEKQSVIFESFRQAEKFTTKQHGGTGLGLSICKKLVEMQGGQIDLKSHEGEGSTFSFWLDFDKSKPVEKPKVKKQQLSELHPLSGMKVLVAEDNPMNVLVLRQFFSKWDIRFGHGKNGKEAIELLEKEEFDLILMDLQMPVMDGYTATKEIRKSSNPRFREIPIIALTASAQIDVKEKAKAIGMDDFVIKPFKPSDLHVKLSRYFAEAKVTS